MGPQCAFGLTIGWVSLISFVTSHLPSIEKSRLVKEYVNEYGDWNWSAFSAWLPNTILLHIAAMLPHHAGAGDDTAFWNNSSSGQFQVKEAYSSRKLESWDARDNKWDCVWKWPGPDRVKTFL